MAVALEKAGIPVWIDHATLKDGVLFEEIAEALRASKLILVCVSDQYLASTNCMMEYRFAVRAWAVFRRPNSIAFTFARRVF